MTQRLRGSLRIRLAAIGLGVVAASVATVGPLAIAAVGDVVHPNIHVAAVQQPQSEPGPLLPLPN